MELKNIFALSPKEITSTSIVGRKYEKTKALKEILSKFDWQNTDLYERQNQIETDELKHVFLTTYQLLAELNKINTDEKKEIKKGKFTSGCK